MTTTRDFDIPRASWSVPIEGESPKMFTYFQEFVRLGDDRSLGGLAKKLHLQHGYVKNIAAQFKWTTRLAAYLSWKAQEDAAAVARMQERTRQAENRVAEKAFRFIEREIDKHITGGKGAEDAMPFSSLSQAADIWARFSRPMRNDPTSHVVTERMESLDTLLEKINEYRNRKPIQKTPDSGEVDLQGPTGPRHDPRNKSSL